MTIKTKKFAVIALGICTIAGFTSCKSNESMYKKAYEKAQAQAKTEQTTTVVRTDEPAPVRVTPVTPSTTTKAPETSNDPIRQEKLTVISGAGLKAYSVVCGSFGLKANAEGLQNTLKQKGYAAQIAYNDVIKFYRVIATTFDSKAEASESKKKLSATYPDAWLLYNK